MADPAILKFLAALEETQYLAPDRMAAYQHRLLDRLLRHALSQTTFYADRLAPVFRADDGIDWERWTEIPILTRAEAQANEAGLIARSAPAAAGAAIPSLTSGSTGRPLRHANSAIQNIATACANERFFRWHNLDPHALAAFIIDVPAGQARYPAGATTANWRLTDEDSPGATLTIDAPVFQQVEWLRRTRPATLTTFPTNLREIGRIAQEAGEPLAFDAVLTIGEAVSPAARREIRQLFGRGPLDRYGSTEIGHMAGACPHSGAYHVCADLVRIEVVDDGGRPVSPGVPGRIIATSFYNFATPFIRYDTGDIGVLAAEPCGCGRTLPLMDAILGRSRGIFRFADGSSAFPHIESEDVQPFVPHRQFQMVQTAVDRIEYRYVPADPEQRNDLAGLSALVRAQLHPSLTVEAIAVATLDRDPSGKYEDYVSLVQPPAANSR